MQRNSGGGASAGPMQTIIVGFVGLLVITVIVILGPALLGAMTEAVPASVNTCTYTNATEAHTYYGKCGTTNATDLSGHFNTAQANTLNWNPNYNSAIPSGTGMWTTTIAIGGVCILVFFIALAIYYIRVIA